MVEIDGSRDFPWADLGLRKGCIKRKGSYLLVPVELFPYLKIHRLPLRQRELIAEKMNKYNARKRDGRKSTRRERYR